MTREQFKRLLDQMKPPLITAVQPPAEYLVTKSVYRGRISSANAIFRADFGLEIFPAARSTYTHIPLFPVNIALKDVFLDGSPALVVLQNNMHTVAANKAGAHQIGVDFSLRTTGEQGPQAVSFPIARTPITSLEIDIPYTQIEVEITNAQQIEVSERGGLTHVSALLSPTDRISLNWRKRLPEAAKGPAKVYADTITLVSIEDNALRLSTDISISVLQNTIPSVTLRIPDGYNVLNVQGAGLRKSGLRVPAIALLASSILFWMSSQALAVLAFIGFLTVLFLYKFKKTTM